MKAVFVPRSGSPDVMYIGDAPKPEPGKGDLLVRVRWASVTSGDVNMRRLSRVLLSVLGFFFGFKPMTISGVEFSGDVESIGAGVTRFAPGDAVVGTCTGLRHGANAEYVVVPESGRTNVVARKPDGLSHRDAVAVVVGSTTAQQILQPQKLSANDRVLIYGASGSVGSYALQFAVLSGATVTGVCSGRNTELVQSLGAAEVLDYAADDLSKLSGRFSVVMDAVGKLAGGTAKTLLAPGGRRSSVKKPTKEVLSELEHALALASEGKLTAVIDREVGLEEVPDAHRYAETGRKRGNLVVKVAGEEG